MELFEILNIKIINDDRKSVEQCIKKNSLSHAMYVDVCGKHTKKTAVLQSWICNPESPMLSKEYPAIAAAEHGKLDILQTLVSLGFDPNFVSIVYEKDREQCAINYACRNGHLAVVKYLIEELGVPLKSNTATSALYSAIEGDQLEIVEYLVRQGAPLDESDPVMRQTPLHWAVFANNEVVVKFLVQKGANVNAGDKFRTTPLVYAVRGSIEIVQTLIEAGAAVEGIANGRYPLTVAFKERRLDIMRYLCSKGANPERPLNSFLGADILIHAILFNEYEFVRYLVVELNVPVNRNKGPVPLDKAVEKYKPSIMNLLLDSELSCRPSGYQFNFWDSVREDERVHISNLFRRLVESPPTLSQLCCFQIRRTLGRNLPNVVDSLPLPRKMIDFVKLTHIPLRADGYDRRDISST